MLSKSFIPLVAATFAPVLLVCPTYARTESMLPSRDILLIKCMLWTGRVVLVELYC